nr:hypothetical protein Iba_chr06bCG11780 [Ipomoea batatas]
MKANDPIPLIVSKNAPAAYIFPLRLTTTVNIHCNPPILWFFPAAHQPQPGVTTKVLELVIDKSILDILAIIPYKGDFLKDMGRLILEDHIVPPLPYVPTDNTEGSIPLLEFPSRFIILVVPDSKIAFINGDDLRGKMKQLGFDKPLISPKSGVFTISNSNLSPFLNNIQSSVDPFPRV